MTERVETSVRIIHVADTHLGFDHPIHPRKDLQHRGEDFFGNFTRVLTYAVENHADYIVHTGDLFFRSRVLQGIINRVFDMIHRAQILLGPDPDSGKRMPVVYCGSVERTSSAEKSELKGFFDLIFRFDRYGEVIYSGIDFIPLPAHPMEEIYIPADLSPVELTEFLRMRIHAFDPGSIVYFRCSGRAGARTAVIPGGKYLRRIMPPQMIAKFTRSCFV
jgi:hypothetical protein